MIRKLFVVVLMTVFSLSTGTEFFDFGCGDVFAKSSSSSSGSRSSSSGYSKPSFSKPSYSKPSASVSKASTPSTPSQSPFWGRKSSGGYNKPVANNQMASAQVGTATASKGYQKPTATVASTVPTSVSKGYQKPGTAGNMVADKKVLQPKDTAYTTALRKERASVVSEKTTVVEQNRSTPTFKNVVGENKYSATDVKTSKSQYYTKNRSYNERGFNRYDYGERSFGGFDPSFLMVMAMSDEPGNAALWYGLTGSPWLAMWMSQSKENAKGDPEVLARLEKIEKQVSGPAPAGTPPVADTLKNLGVPAAVAFSEETLTGEPDVTPHIRFATGGTDGVYFQFCSGDGQSVNGFKNYTGEAVPTTCVPYGGSKEIGPAVVSGDAQCGIMQSDVIDQISRNGSRFGSYQTTAYPEPFWLLVNKKSGIDEVDGLDPSKHTLLMGGSGSAASWSNLAHHSAKSLFGNKRYANFNPQTVDRVDGIKQVASNKNAVMLVVMGLNSPFLQMVNDTYGDSVSIVPFNDSKFNNVEDSEGNHVYDFVTVPGGKYPNLQEGWFSTSVETLAVQAVVVCNEDAVKRLGKTAEGVVQAALSMSVSDIQTKTLGLE